MPNKFFRLDKTAQRKEAKGVSPPLQRLKSVKILTIMLREGTVSKKNCECGYWYIEITETNKKLTKYLRWLSWNHNLGRSAYPPKPTSDAVKDNNREETLRMEHKATEKWTGKNSSRTRIRA